MLTCSVAVTVVVQASSGYRLAAKQRITVKVVAKFFQEAKNVGDTADCGQCEGVLLLLKVGWAGQTDERLDKTLFNDTKIHRKNNFRIDLHITMK